MNLVMPGTDGYEATRQIEVSIPVYRVITLSMHSYPSARQRASQAGADLSKKELRSPKLFR